jgi:GntR family transcriptional repressor for pyruvate dehydrogenase complex
MHITQHGRTMVTTGPSSTQLASFTSLADGRRLSDRVADALLEHILSADLQPGDRLPTEAELGRQFEVSRTVIREAVRSLAARGVVQVRPGAGLTVSRVDASTASASLRLVVRGSTDLTYDRVHEVRRSIEVELARLAAERATDEEIEELARILAAQAAAFHDIPRAARIDTAFHRLIATMTRNDLFVIMLDSLADVMLQVRLQAMPTPGDRENGVAEHGAILEAIRARDPAAARRAMSEHLVSAYRTFRTTDPLLHGVPGRAVRPEDAGSSNGA